MRVISNQYSLLRDYASEGQAVIRKKRGGFSLIELLVVMSLFVVVTYVVGQALFSTIKGNVKSDTTIRVKQNGSNAISVMERTLHSAKSVICTTAQKITYTDTAGVNGTYECSGNNILQNTSALLPADVWAGSCNFICSQEGGATTINLSITFTQAIVEGQRVEEKISVPLQTKIRLRNRS